MLLLAAAVQAVGMLHDVATGVSHNIVVEPVVAASGETLLVTGAACTPGVVNLSVVGRTTGWYDEATIFDNRAITPSVDGNWSAEIEMPNLPATVRVSCTGPAPFNGSAKISPIDTGVTLMGILPTDLTVVLGPETLDNTLEAYTTDAVPVPITVDRIASAVRVIFGAIEPGTSVILLGDVSFGENAEARQVQSVAAWRFDSNPPPSTYTSLVPSRLMDTRVPASATVDGLFQAIGLRMAGSTTELQITGRAGIPADADTVVLNVTVTGTHGAGFITVYPCGLALPNASNLNFVADDTIPNLVVSQIGTDGKICLYTSAATHLIADLNGYYET